MAQVPATGGARQRGGSAMARAESRGKSRKVIILSAAIAGLGTLRAHQAVADPAEAPTAGLLPCTPAAGFGFDSATLSGGPNWDTTRSGFDPSLLLDISVLPTSLIEAQPA